MILLTKLQKKVGANSGKFVYLKSPSLEKFINKNQGTFDFINKKQGTFGSRVWGATQVLNLRLLLRILDLVTHPVLKKHYIEPFTRASLFRELIKARYFWV